MSFDVFLKSALIFSATIAGVRIGFIIGTQVQYKAAIEAGVAHWEINTQTGNRTFVYGAGNREKP